jgi:ankyrin repeat protein
MKLISPQEGKTALMRAAFGGDTLGHIEAVRFLMQLGAQSNPQKPGALTNLQDQVSC